MSTEKPTLLIIDMQRGMRNSAAGKRNNPHAEMQISALLSTWRAMHARVVHVRHISRTPTSLFWPGQAGAEFQHEFMPLIHEHVVEKNVPDAFVHTGLERWLHVRGVTRLVIVGVSTNSSVESTARTAGNLGFETQVVADACYAYAKLDFDGTAHTAEVVHAMALSNLDGEFASVLTTADILSAMENLQ